MVNIEFLVVTYIIGMFVDWVFQIQWQAINKSKWGKSDNKTESLMAVLSHSATYSLLTTTATKILMPGISEKYFMIILLVLFISHAIIDTRIPVKFILWCKGMEKEQIKDIQNFGFMHIGIDHRLHELVLLILSIFIK